MTKFKKGQSGNPTGRKRGSVNKRTKLAKLLEPHAENLINKTVELALGGDVNALRLCIERLIPKATNQNINLDFQNIDLESPDSLSTTGRKIITAITTGDIAPNEGKEMMGILESQRKLIEHVDISRKLEEITEHLQSGKHM